MSHRGYTGYSFPSLENTFMSGTLPCLNSSVMAIHCKPEMTVETAVIELSSPNLMRIIKSGPSCDS